MPVVRKKAVVKTVPVSKVVIRCSIASPREVSGGTPLAASP